MKCKHCNKDIATGRSDKVYCSGDCRMAFWLKHNRAYKNKLDREYVKKNKKRVYKKIKEYYQANKESWNRKCRQYEDKRYINSHRQEVYKRDNNKCIYCGMSMRTHTNKYGKKLLVAHEDGTNPRKDKTDNSLQNLITICQKCHFKRFNSKHAL